MTLTRTRFTSLYLEFFTHRREETEKVHLASMRVLPLFSLFRSRTICSKQAGERNRQRGNALPPVSAISMHLRFPRWCNKLLLIRVPTFSYYVTVCFSPSFSWSTYIALLPETTRIYIFPLEAFHGEFVAKGWREANQVCPLLIPAAVCWLESPAFSLQEPKFLFLFLSLRHRQALIVTELFVRS